MTNSTNQHQSEQPLFVDRQGNPVKLEFPESTDPKNSSQPDLAQK